MAVVLNLFVLEAHKRIENSSAAHFHMTIFKLERTCFMGRLTISWFSLEVFSVMRTKHALGAGDLEFEPRAGQISTESPMARHRCDVFSGLCSPGAMPRNWAPPLVTRFGVIPRA